MRKHRVKPVLLGVLAMLLAVAIGLAAEGCIPWGSKNPYSSVLLSKQTENMIFSIRRLDQNGYLYYAEYDGDYTDRAIFLSQQLCRLAKPGCTVFTCQNEDGEPVFCRNYDAPHIKNGQASGLNVILHTTGGDKYEVYAGVDAAWICEAGLSFYAGALDNGKTNLTPLALLPFLCMDGMNECGLSAAILSVDITDDEKPIQQNEDGKDSITMPVLLRQVLDHAANIQEAETIAESYNLVNISGNSYHLYLCDATGQSEVIEWRYGVMTVTETDIATNFFLGYDDAADCYYGADLKEAYTPVTDASVAPYRFGYGHGYARFQTVAHALLDKRVDGVAVLSEAEMTQVQQSVWQTWYGGVDSQSQYSAQYNLSNRSISYRTYFEPDEIFTFSFGE